MANVLGRLVAGRLVAGSNITEKQVERALGATKKMFVTSFAALARLHQVRHAYFLPESLVSLAHKGEIVIKAACVSDDFGLRKSRGEVTPNKQFMEAVYRMQGDLVEAGLISVDSVPEVEAHWFVSQATSRSAIDDNIPFVKGVDYVTFEVYVTFPII